MFESVKKIFSIINYFNQVYLYCVDPGAFNIMLPAYNYIKSHNKKVTWIFQGWCKSHKGKDISFIEWHNFSKFYQKGSVKDVCLILGSQRDSKCTHKIIQFSKINKIFSIFLFDHWVNYLLHFWDKEESQLYIPDKICVMDNIAKNSLIKELHSVIDNRSFVSRIEVIGHPFIEKCVQSILNIPYGRMENIKKKLNPDGKKIILFLLEPIEKDFGLSLGFTEYTILKYFFKNFSISQVKVIIKPHPRQELEMIKKFLINYSKFDNILTIDEPLESLIAISDEVVGMTSVALIIALKAGKKIQSIQVGRNEKGIKLSNEYLEENLIL